MKPVIEVGQRSTQGPYHMGTEGRRENGGAHRLPGQEKWGPDMGRVRAVTHTVSGKGEMGGPWLLLGALRVLGKKEGEGSCREPSQERGLAEGHREHKGARQPLAWAGNQIQGL